MDKIIRVRNKSYRFVFVFLIAASSLFFLQKCGDGAPLETVAKVDPLRYAGRWYEIAAFPMRAQKNCKCTYAEYKVLEPGVLNVYNRCIDKKSLEIKYISGTAYVEEGSGNARLKVQFFKLITAPYYIIALDEENYDYAMVGTPDRDYLWILSRQTTLADKQIDALVKKAESLGFDITKLRYTTHDCPSA